ncbi:MAG: hypothetical protein ACTSWG_03150 [Candidatus Helarchaeota archaeon]
MKKLLFILTWLCIFLVYSINSYSFVCILDGTCFSYCIEQEDNIDYCKLKCTVCRW